MFFCEIVPKCAKLSFKKIGDIHFGWFYTWSGCEKMCFKHHFSNPPNPGIPLRLRQWQRLCYRTQAPPHAARRKIISIAWVEKKTLRTNVPLTEFRPILLNHFLLWIESTARQRSLHLLRHRSQGSPESSLPNFLLNPRKGKSGTVILYNLFWKFRSS